MSNPSRKLAFIDLEASGLSANSWPIEIGWAFPDGPPQSVLLRPDETWPLSAWDPSAQALHGISRDHLQHNGVSCLKACQHLNQTLHGVEVYSDAPDWDGFWLMRAFHSAHIKPQFTLLDYGKLMAPLTTGREAHLFKIADTLAPRTHRAADDAGHLRTLYNLATGKTE